MATMTVRATYALDPETVGTLERLARRWGVSKSAALRRAIQAAGGRRGGADEALRALDSLQESARLSGDEADRWASQARTARRSASSRRIRRPR
jgi:hypothetical protein